MENLLDRRRYMGRSPLYNAEIEYIEVNEDSGGYPYIDTLYVPKGQDIRIKTVITLLGYNANRFWASWFYAGYFPGNLAETDMYTIKGGLNSDEEIYIACGGNLPYNNRKAVTVGEKHDIDLSFGQCIINGTTWSVNTNLVGENMTKLTIFSSNSDKVASRKVYMRLHTFQLYKGDELILDFIPVRKNQKGYLYNRVDGKLYGNAGDGKFILGPDIPNSRPSI